MGGKVKKGNGKNMGYIGYHTTWDGNTVFLRSKCEFIVARMLDYEKKYYLTEVKDYVINGVGYRPDFFIYEDSEYTNLKSIIEVKGQDSKKVALEYSNKFTKFFESLGIKYTTMWNYNSIIKEYGLTDEIDEWVEKSVELYDHISDTKGENNPMYGRNHSDKTKSLISLKAKERCNNKGYLTIMSQVQKEYWSSETGKKKKREISDRMKLRYEMNNPKVESKCVLCDNTFTKRKKDSKEFCSTKCERKWKYENQVDYGKHKNSQEGYRKNLLTYIDKILNEYGVTKENFLTNIDDYVTKAKKEGVIPKNKGLSLKTLNKYNII